MKAIIPVAGFGTRLKPHTLTAPKVLLPVAGKPILGHILDRIRKLDISEVIFITGYMEDAIRDYVDNNFKIKAKYIQQKELLGLGHAVSLAGRHFGKEPLLIILGDTIFEADLSTLVSQDQSAICVREVEDPSRFGVVLTENKKITRLIEKPVTPVSNLAIVGIYFIREPMKLRQALSTLIKKKHLTRNEYQLTDALQMMIEKGTQMQVFPVKGWYDCGKPETLLRTNQYMLDANKRKSPKQYNKNSVIIPPVFIGKNVKISKSVIGPYVSIDSNAEIEGSVISDSLIGRQAQVTGCLLNKSIVGNHAVVTSFNKKLNVGDFSTLQI